MERGKGTNGNLRPPRSSEDARERGRNGGLKSGIQRRKKKSLSNAVEYLLDKDITKSAWKKKFAMDFSEDSGSYLDYLIAAQIQRAGKGDTYAFNSLVKLLPKKDRFDSINCSRGIHLPANMIATAFVEVNRLIDGNKYHEYVFKGGRGSTKSSYCGIKIPELIVNHPEMHACIVRKIGVTLRDSVFAQIKWGISQLGLDELFESTVSPLEITYIPTGQKIYFRGADDPTKIKSIKPPFGYIGVLWFEELDQFNGEEEVRNIEQSTIRGTDENGESQCYIFKSFNPPKSIHSWVNRYVLEPKLRTYIHHSTYKDVPEEWLGSFFLEEAQSLKQRNEPAYLNEYLGEVTGEGGAVFGNVRSLTITSDMINTFGQCKRGLDWGFAVDPFAYVESYYDRRNKSLYVYNEIYGAQMGFDQVDRELNRVNPRHIAIYADSAEPRSNNELNKRGHCVVPAKKGPGSVDNGLMWLQSLSAIYIDPLRCPNTFREFSGYEFLRTKSGDYYRGYPDRDNHTIDAVRYSLESEIIMGV